MSKAGKAKVLSDVEFKRMVAVVRGSGSRQALRNVAILHVSFYLGFRAKEIASLRVGDIVDAVGSVREEAVLGKRHTKGGKSRQFYLTNKKLRGVLQEYLGSINGDDLDAPLFASQKGGFFSPNTLQMLISRIYREAGIVGASSHSGRRTYATRLIESGIDLVTVSHLMGHSRIATTAIYKETSPEMLKTVAANLKL